MPEGYRRRKRKLKSSTETTLPSYLIERIKALSEDQKIACEADFVALESYRGELEADAVTLARIRADEIEDNILQHYGLERIRLDRKHRPELRVDGSRLMQMKLFPVPEKLQGYAQTTLPVFTDDKNGSGQTTPTFMYYRGTEEILSEAPASRSVVNSNLSASGRAPSVMPEDPPARTPEDPDPKLGRRRRNAPLWQDRVANFLETLLIPTALDKPMLLQITDTLSEELLDQFESAAKGAKYAAKSEDGKGIRTWAGVLAVAKQVADRGLLKAAAAANGKVENDFERRYREEMERRRREEQANA